MGKAIWIALFCACLLQAEEAPIQLNGESLTIEQVFEISKEHAKIEIDNKALERTIRSHALLLAAGKQDLPIYGLNRGVGLNKDRKIFQGDTIDPEVLESSQKFNRSMILSHSTGISTDMPEEIVRAAMVVRLNTLLKGFSGIQPHAIQLLSDFLNRGIHPVMPKRGSVGEADIAILSHIALALMGEGDVHFLGQIMPAQKALQAAGLTPLKPYAKDSLSILSSNAYSVGYAALTLYEAKKLLMQMNLVFALSLEGLNGNIAPFTLAAQQARPYCSQWKMAEHTRELLKGSYLWETSEKRALQDPLSFRTATQVHGAVLDLMSLLENQMSINLNASDDNPAVILDIEKNASTPPQEASYYVNEGGIKGAVIPTANFEPITWILKFEALNIALVHASHNSIQRMIHLADPHLTGLTRFLAGNERAIAFGTIQKAFTALDSENRSLANPVSMDSIPLAGGIEDHSTNAPFVIDRFAKIIDNLVYITAIEEMHAAQAVELRLRDHPELKLGEATSTELQNFRKVIPFLDEDRLLQKDIDTAATYIRTKLNMTNPLRTDASTR